MRIGSRLCCSSDKLAAPFPAAWQPDVSSQFMTPITRVIAHALPAAGLLLALGTPAAAQNEAALRAFFEGKRVVLKIDMPGSSEGVDVRADAGRAVDFQRLGERLKAYGTALHAGETVTVTLVKPKKDLIEFQLNGGGFGTFGDDTSTYVSIRNVEKSNREKELEKRIDDERDPKRKREMRDELDDLRSRRERENRRIEAERIRAQEAKKLRIAEDRLKGGSRFNLRYSDAVPSGIRPEEVMAALGEFVDFGGDAPSQPPPAAVAGLPRKGMSRADAERIFGRPVELSERREGSLAVTRIVFVSGDQRIAAEFVEDVLVRYTITPK